jgi:hypothetical protein
MQILIILAGIYLIAGFLHAAYLFIGGYSPWYQFPFNVVAGPPVLVYILISMLKGKRIPL